MTSRRGQDSVITYAASLAPGILADTQYICNDQVLNERGHG